MFKSTEKILAQHLKTEMGSNHLKVTKWAVQSYLAGVDNMNIAFVSRKDLKSNKEHMCYGFYSINPQQLLNNVNFNHHVGWGIIKQLYETMQNCPNGNYVLMKILNSNKQLVKLYRVNDKSKTEVEVN